MAKYSLIDLFAGAGGLSLGFMQTGKYEIKVAFENNPDMQKTYKKNHPGVEVLGNVCDADYFAIKAKYGDIDVVIGGPPCQGFSNANRQRSSAINQNNMLVKQYIRAILELNPKAFVMENVSMLKSDVHRFYLSRNDEKTIIEYKIPVKETSLYLLDSEFYFEKSYDIVRDLQLISQYMWPDNYYNELNVIYRASKNLTKLREALDKHKEKLIKLSKKVICNNNDTVYQRNKSAVDCLTKYFENDFPIEKIAENIAPAIMTQRMLKKAKEIFDNDIVVDSYVKDKELIAKIRSFAVFDYLKKILESEKHGYILASGVLCAADYGAPQKRDRYVIMGVKSTLSTEIELPKGTINAEKYYTVRDALEDISDVDPVMDVNKDSGIQLTQKEVCGLTAKLRDSRVLFNHIITNSTSTAKERFAVLKPGQNFHSLDESLKTNTYTDASRTQNTIYLRLLYDEPCGTVVNVRKSMWIHPTHDRALSIREAARLQTFPDSFIFCGTKDKQYQQVGNAVPPIMAKAIAEKLYSTLNKSKGSGYNG